MGNKLGRTDSKFKAPALGVEFPDYKAICTKTEATPNGTIHWHQYIEGSWAILLSHPAAYTPICTTELGKVANLKSEFAARGVKVCGLSCDTVKKAESWRADIEKVNGGDPVDYPIVCDKYRTVAVALGMLDSSDESWPSIPLPVRGIFIVGPDKRLKLSMLYPHTTGRDFAEILRAIDSLQLTHVHRVGTPANWRAGEPCYVALGVQPSEFSTLFPSGVEVVDLPSGKPYLKRTAQPQIELVYRGQLQSSIGLEPGLVLDN